MLGNPAHECVSHGTRLLKDFLKHEVAEASLFRCDRVPADVQRFGSHGHTLEIDYPHSFLCNDGKLTISQKKEIARAMQDRGNIRSDKVFAVAHPDHSRGTIARRDDFIWLLHEHGGQS